jgi:hypothetical protein
MQDLALQTDLVPMQHGYIFIQNETTETRTRNSDSISYWLIELPILSDSGTLEEKSAKSWSDSPGNCAAMGVFPLVNKVTCQKLYVPLNLSKCSRCN